MKLKIEWREPTEEEMGAYVFIMSFLYITSLGAISIIEPFMVVIYWVLLLGVFYLSKLRINKIK